MAQLGFAKITQALEEWKAIHPLELSKKVSSKTPSSTTASHASPQEFLCARSRTSEAPRVCMLIV